MHARCGTRIHKRTFNQFRKSSPERLVSLIKKCNQPTPGTNTSLLEELKWPSLEQRRKQTRLTNFYKIVNGTLAVEIPNYFSQKERQIRNYHPLKYINAGCRTNIYKYSFFPHPLKNGTNFPEQLLKLPTQRSSSLPWGPRPGPIEHLKTCYFFITSTNSMHCLLAHRAQAQHISAEDGPYCPLQIRH